MAVVAMQLLVYHVSMDIVGHQDQLKLLKGYIEAERVPHAFLFAGIAGLGKSKVAREFFRSLNCRRTPGDPCGSCSSCVKAEAGNHPDYIHFEPPSSGKQIDVLRGVLADIRLKPFEAARRVVVIEPTEGLNKSSANALLKALEEPPEATIFILVSHKPNLLLPTIISRCQQVRFAPLEAGGYHSASVDPQLLRLTSGTIGELAAGDQAEILRFRQGVLDILRGGDPVALAASITSNDKESVPLWISVVESVLRDVLLYFAGGDKLVNVEIADIELRHLPSSELDEMADAIRRLRRGVQENLNLKVAFSEIFMLMGRLAA